MAYELMMTAEKELAPALADLQDRHDLLPFLDRPFPAERAAFRRLPDLMVDLIARSPDFTPPERGSKPFKIRFATRGPDHLELIVARARVDGELWVIAPREIRS